LWLLMGLSVMARLADERLQKRQNEAMAAQRGAEKWAARHEYFDEQGNYWPD